MELVQSVREGPPARAVGSRGANITGRYPSQKMARTIQYESRTVEFAHVILCETDPEVREYFDQPCQLPLEYKSATGRPVRTTHTPDFLVLGTEYAGFVECKAVDSLAKLAEKQPHRYVDAGDGGWQCPPGEDAAARYGLGYRVWTPAGVSPALIDTARFLEQEWGRSDEVFSDDDVERVLAPVRDEPGVRLEDLVAGVGDPDLVHWCIFCRRIHV
ncbi:MAG: hypothetical protein OXG35_28900, partial [Acidobacteria bacterium]|nr:hypothetical protein [Acidobacteriota bacterium]